MAVIRCLSALGPLPFRAPRAYAYARALLRLLVRLALLLGSGRTLSVPHTQARFVPYVNTWLKEHPGWEYKFWTDSEMDNLVQKHYPQYWSMYQECVPPSLPYVPPRRSRQIDWPAEHRTGFRFVWWWRLDMACSAVLELRLSSLNMTRALLGWNQWPGYTRD